MHDMMRMCDLIEAEISKIAEKGLTSTNLDTAYKLIDMRKDLMELGCDSDGYSEARSMRYDDGNSTRRHYVRGHYSMRGGNGGYSRDDYKSTTRSLEEYLDDYTGQLEDMMRDANPEERETIKRYMQKIKSM